MTLAEKTVYWLICDDCKTTYGHQDEPEMFGQESYENYIELQEDAKRDGWVTTGNEDWYCEDDGVRRGLHDLTPLQQAVLMHGGKVQVA